MTLKEAFRAAIELSPEDLLRLQDNISAVLEVGAAKPAPDPQLVNKPRSRRVKKQNPAKPADKVQTKTATGVSDSDAPWS